MQPNVANFTIVKNGVFYVDVNVKKYFSHNQRIFLKNIPSQQSRAM